MNFTFKGVDFECDGVYRPMAQSLFKLLPQNEDIFQIDFIKEDDEIVAYVYIHGESEEEYSDATEKFVDTLTNRGFNVMISDEDYGCTDMVIVTFSAETIEMIGRLWDLQSMRRVYMGSRCIPRPTSSPYDAEISELKRLLGDSE